MHKPKYRNCRSFKNFDKQNFLSDLQDIKWDIERNTNVNTAYESFNSKFIEVANKHAPVKHRKILPQQTPCMNKQLGTDHLTCREGGYVFFVQNIFFRTTRELEYLFFLLREARDFFPEFNIRLYDKNSESDFFFFHQNQNIFSATLGIRIFF